MSVKFGRAESTAPQKYVHPAYPARGHLALDTADWELARGKHVLGYEQPVKRKTHMSIPYARKNQHDRDLAFKPSIKTFKESYELSRSEIQQSHPNMRHFPQAPDQVPLEPQGVNNYHKYNSYAAKAGRRAAPAEVPRQRRVQSQEFATQTSGARVAEARSPHKRGYAQIHGSGAQTERIDRNETLLPASMPPYMSISQDSARDTSPHRITMRHVMNQDTYCPPPDAKVTQDNFRGDQRSPLVRMHRDPQENRDYAVTQRNYNPQNALYQDYRVREEQYSPRETGSSGKVSPRHRLYNTNGEFLGHAHQTHRMLDRQQRLFQSSPPTSVISDPGPPSPCKSASLFSQDGSVSNMSPRAHRPASNINPMDYQQRNTDGPFKWLH